MHYLCLYVRPVRRKSKQSRKPFFMVDGISGIKKLITEFKIKAPKQYIAMKIKPVASSTCYPLFNGSHKSHEQN